MQKKEIDLTQGGILRPLLLFAIPLLISSFIQQMYNTVDLLYAGNFLGERAIAAVGASSLIISCIVGVFTGISVGTGIIVSHAVGARNTKKVNALIYNGLVFAVVGGILLMLAGLLGADKMLQLIHTPKAIFEDAASYIKAYMVSILFIFLFNMNAGVIRAIGNSYTPMLLQLLGGIINIGMDYVFIRIFGVVGIAWASVASQGIPAVLSTVYLLRSTNQDPLYITAGHDLGTGFCFDRYILMEIIKMGLPAGIQNLVITLSNIFVQMKINSYGVVAISSFAAYFKIELIDYLPIVAFGSAVMTFVGQNVGAENYERVKKGVRIGILYGVLYVIVVSASILCSGNYLFGIFVPEAKEVAACGNRILRVTMPFYWIYVILEVLADSLRGIGKSAEPMWVLLLTLCGFRTVCLLFLTSLGDQIELVAAVYPLAWAAAALALVLVWQRSMRR